MLMPQIPLDYRTSLDKAMLVVSELKMRFALIVIFSKLTITIKKRTPSYRKDKMGALEIFHPEFSMFAKKLCLHFKCEGESDRLCQESFSKEIIETLVIALAHPDEFDIFAANSKDQWQIGILSQIL